MFDRQRPVLRAAGTGFLLAGVLLAVTAGAVSLVSRTDPYRLVRDFDQLLTQRGEFFGVGVLAGLLLFGVALAGLLLWLAVAARAARLHPTSAAVGGLFLTLAMASLAALAVWTGIVSSYASLQYRTAEDEMRKHALLVEAYISEHVVMLAFWCFLGFTAAGLYFLGRALRGERGWLPDVLRLAAAVLLLHLPLTIYLARESLGSGNYVRWLAMLDQFLLWGSLAVASLFCARWLRRLGRTLPR